MAKFKGPLSNDDRQFVLKNMNNMSISEMAEKLEKNPVLIEKVIRTYTAMPNIANDSVRWRLKKSNHWKQLKQAFTESELSYIEDEYVVIINQFQENVVPTEEVQILDFIKTSVLQQRNLEAKRRISDSLDSYAKMVQDIEDSYGNNFSEMTEEDKNRIMDLKNKEAACRQAESARTTEWLALQKEKDVLYDKLMGSRDQRVKEALNTKVSFLSHVKELLERDRQEKDSRIIGLYKKSVNKEYDRLRQPHAFADKVIDNPILNSDVVEYFDKMNEKQEEESNDSE